MKRIIIHWTAGRLQPNTTDYQHYHFLINGDGVLIKGKFPVGANEKCKVDARNNPLYAAHCGGGNTGSIGVAMCGMYTPRNTDFRNSTDLLTRPQCERCFKLIAELSKLYKIPITSDTVLTHYEFGLKHPKTTSAGKIDIVYLPPFPELKTSEIGDFIRNKANWYLKNIKEEISIT